MSIATTAGTINQTRTSDTWTRFLAGLVSQVQGWRYQGGKRDLRLDLLRGFAALAMIVDHTGGQSWLQPVTGGNRFLVSAAEPFVFISGALAGIVYGKLMLTQGALAGLRKTASRAAKLYLLTIVLTLGFAAAGSLLGLWWSTDLGSGSLRDYLVDVVTLRRTTFLVDIPLMYTLLLLGAGPILFLLARGYTALVILGSWLIWGIWQISPGSIGWHIEGNGVFHIAAWQVIFVTGMVVGYHRAALEAWSARLPRTVLAISLVFVAAVVVMLYVLQVTHLEALRGNARLYALGFDKADVPIGRLMAFALFATFTFALLTLAWQPVRSATGWLLLPLGQNALTAYSLHIFLVVLTTALTARFFDGELSPGVSTAIQVAGVLIVWLVVKFEPGVRAYVSSRLAHSTQHACERETAPLKQQEAALVPVLTAIAPAAKGWPCRSWRRSVRQNAPAGSRRLRSHAVSLLNATTYRSQE